MSAITVVALVVTLAATGGTLGVSALAADLLSRMRGGSSGQVRSRKVTANTPFVEEGALRKALADLGIKQADIRGLTGTGKPNGIAVRRGAVPWLKKDIRFEKGPDGKFRVVAGGCPAASVERWLKELVPRYAYHVTLEKLGDQGFDLIAEETQQDGRIRLMLRRMT